jgi:hypothetical protein
MAWPAVGASGGASSTRRRQWRTGGAVCVRVGGRCKFYRRLAHAGSV